MSDSTPDTDFTPPEPEEIGKLLPAYEVHHLIAKGGMGAVYLARQKSLERDVAIKVLPRHFGEDAEFRASFETEAKSMAKLNHPNLISIYDFGQVDGLLYIIMEMVQGKSLYYSAYGKTIDPQEAAGIAIGICRGLASAHSHGILHRDIKPANILLAPDASPKIGDFGLARPVSETDAGLAFGTPGYAAPEVVHSPSAVDQSTDIYSVGVILYELLTGHLPDKNYSPAATEIGCDSGFDRIIRKATHPTPALRYRDAATMADDLEKIAHKKPNPLLVESGSKPSSSTAKTLLTSPPASSPKPGSGKPAASPAARAAARAASQQAGSNVPLVRNIIIIIALLAAIYIAWEGYKSVRSKREAEQALVDEERAKREREAKDEKERVRKEKQAAIDAMQAKDTKKPVGSTPDALKPKEETPLETLARLRPALFRGKRNTMPKSTIKGGERARFYISTPMTWHAAQQFCERHGGHLAVFPTSGDLQVFTARIKSGAGVWLGAGTAGTGEWRWIDGTPWNQDIRKTSKAAYVSVDDTGILKPQPAQTKLPFFIEWMMDGTAPATLEAQLKRCAGSAQSGTPEYPAGSASYDNRHFLHVERSCDWQTARDYASAAGGVLAVPSTVDENIWMTAFVAKKLGGRGACWIGGIHPAEGAWQWANGEPWKFARWKDGAPDGDTGRQLACAVTPAGSWDDFPADTQLDSFLIEWSKDGAGMKTVKTEKAASSDPVAPVRAKCANLLRGIQKRYEKEFRNNIKGYEQELSVYKRNLVHSQQKALAPGILEMQSRYKNGRIPADLPRRGMPKELAGILDSRLEKQSRIEERHTKEVEDIRRKYRTSLQQMSGKLKEQGLASRLRKVQDELDDTDGDAASFLGHILGN